MKEEILSLLRGCDDFVSGQTICEKLGVSRTAVWKCVNQLKKEGYEIESVTRKGYRLLRSPDLLLEDEICSLLPPGMPAGQLCCFSRIDSTNEEAKRRALAGAPDDSVYVADIQTRGKGRRGRNWISPGGEDLFYTILKKPEIPLNCISMITLVAALSVAEAVEKHGGETCQIKWPNDLIIHGKKICGILTEMGAEMDRLDYVVIGVGINVNRVEFHPEIADHASSVFKESGRRVRRARLLADAIAAFEKNYRQFAACRDMTPFLKDYNDRLVNVNREVRIIKDGKELIRRALGINERGELLVVDELGRKEYIFSGEVSVRGIYGYV